MVNMARWCTLTLLLLASLESPSNTFAQMYDPAAPGVEPAGWSQSGYAQAGQKAKVRSYGPVGPLPAGPGRTIFEQLPDDQGWLYEDTPLERMLKNTFRHAYFRTDYLLWSVSKPGNNLVGSDTAIIGLDELTQGGLENSPVIVGNPDSNTFAYPDPVTNPYIFQPFVDPVQAFQISNPIEQNTSLLAVVQPSLQDVDIDSNNGIRLTFGLPTNIGTFEASVFALQNSNSTLFRAQSRQFDFYDSDGDGISNETFTPTAAGIGEFDRDGDGIVDEVVNDFQAFAIPILIDGQVPQPGVANPNNTPGVTGAQLPPITNPLSPGTFNNPNPDLNFPGGIQATPGRGDNFRIVWAIRDPNNPGDFISTYSAFLKTSVWGSEANFIGETWDPGSPISFRPFAGFRYLYFAEDFRQSGLYTDVVVDPNTNAVTESNINRRIDATTINNLYGPQIGFRSELTSRWLTIGAQPKVMMGLNTYKANLQTENILRDTDVDQFLSQNESTFGVIGDLEAYTRLHLTEYISLHVGYNLMWAGMLTRPYDNIVYNANTVQIPNGDGTVTNRYDSDFKLDVKYSGALLQGFNVGGEIHY